LDRANTRNVERILLVAHFVSSAEGSGPPGREPPEKPARKKFAVSFVILSVSLIFAVRERRYRKTYMKKTFGIDWFAVALHGALCAGFQGDVTR
jgi:hypothetical protein